MNPSLCFLPVDFYRFAADAPVVRYAKIAMTLTDKTVRDVALRCRWMAVSWMLRMSCVCVNSVSIYINLTKQRMHCFIFLGMLCSKLQRP